MNFHHRLGHRNASFRALLGSVISSDKKIASLDIAAFLNAELPPGRVVVHRAIHGLREAPSLWQNKRTGEVTKVKLKVQGEDARAIISQVHQSLCTIVKEGDLEKAPNISKLSIEKRVEPRKILAMIGIYVEDYLTGGQPETVENLVLSKAIVEH